MSAAAMMVRVTRAARAPRPQWAGGLAFVVFDILSFLCAGALALLGRQLLAGPFDASRYLALTPLALLYPAALEVTGLYPAIALNPAAELRGVFHAATLTCLWLAAVSFFQRDAAQYSRGALLLTWLLTVLIAPLLRSRARALLCRSGWWGARAILVSAGHSGRRVLEALRRNPGLGIDVVAVLNAGRHARAVRRLEHAPRLAGELGATCVILALAGEPGAELSGILERHLYPFRHVLVVPLAGSVPGLDLSVRDLGGVLALGLRQPLLHPLSRWAKRAFDLAGAAAAGVLLLPLLACIWAAIRLTSRGPALYPSLRIGRGGKRFSALKFRTMSHDGDAGLEGFMRLHPELRAQWIRDRKLKRDPRITPVGRWLRRSSLDELPQLWNVLRGEMSLVGPRPILEEEVPRYGSRYLLYRRARPGITGLWQVSGRNDANYHHRLACVDYYVRNWSFWLDLLILGRTIKVVLNGQGAY
jgi:Undecaprenyl-phosphate galactose phosphotransferase WbaP